MARKFCLCRHETGKFDKNLKNPGKNRGNPAFWGEQVTVLMTFSLQMPPNVKSAFEASSRCNLLRFSAPLK